MANYDGLVTIATNTGFQGRVQYALFTAAVNVMSESSTTTNHQRRVNYAVDVLNGSANILNAAYATLTNSTISAEANVSNTPDYSIPDSDIQFSVNSLFNALAGIGS